MESLPRITDQDIREGMFARVCCNEYLRHVNASMTNMTGHWVRITKRLADSRDGDGRYAAKYYPEDNVGLPALTDTALTNCWAWRAYMFDAVSNYPARPILPRT